MSKHTYNPVLALLAIPLISFLLVCFAYSTPAHAVQTIPYKMNFQGRLTDSVGAPKADGTYNMKFRIYDASTGGTVVWSEERAVSATTGVTLVDGLFSVQLGDVSSLTPSIFTDPDLYLEVELPTPATATCATAACAVYTEGAMTPRNKFGSTAYAFNADTVDGYDSSYFATATGGSGYIQNTTTPQTADFNITGAGTADILRATTFDRATAGTLTVGGTNATSISLADDTTLASGKTLRVVGDTYTNIEGYGSPTEGQITYDQTNDQLLVYNATLGKWMSDKSDAILVAASNSSQADKNAADYVADGIADQTEINNALTAASGKKVVLLAGTYTASATILVPNNTTLAGVGLGTLVQLADIDVTDNVIQNSDTATGTGVVVRDLKIDGQKSLNTVGTQHGVYFTAVGDGRGSGARRGGVIENVHAVSLSGTGIVLVSSDNNLVKANSSEGNYGGILLDGSYHNTIESNITHDTGYAGIQLQNSSMNNNIANNRVFFSANSGIRIQSTSAFNNVTGNQVSDNTTYGLYISTTSNTVANNFIGDSNYGIVMPSGSGNNSVTGNTIRELAVDAIFLQNTSGNLVSDNTIETITDDGIVVDAESHKNTVMGNKLDSIGDVGILLSGVTGDEPTGNIIEGNNINAATGRGISLTLSHDNAITGNSIKDSGGSNDNYGIYLTSSDSNSITSNVITDTSCGFALNCRSIYISDSLSDNNYLADNLHTDTDVDGTSYIMDNGTNTLFSNQIIQMDSSSKRFVTSTTSQTYASQIINTNTSTTADGLLIELGVTSSSRTTGNYFIGFAGASSAVAGKIQGGASAVAYTTSGADYAEYFKADPQAMPQSGELVMLDANSSQSVVRTNGNTQRPLAGIVSTSPGFIGNGPICDVDDEDCDANYAKYNALVALSGQVPTKVNTSNGLIAIGDPIMASNVAGEGAKATSAGHIVGYALEPLSSGSGTIEVLVRPQHYAPAMSQVLQAADLMLSANASIAGSLNVSGPTTITSLTVAQNAEFKGELVVRGDTKVVNLYIDGRLVSRGALPQAAKGVALQGVNEVTITNSGTSSAGTIIISVGDAQITNTGGLAQITFTQAYKDPPKVVISGNNKQSVTLGAYIERTEKGFTLVADEPLMPNTTYTFDYIVVGAEESSTAD
ncbi:hypothetical protein EOL96_01105 [Candidatus Saccharibacteria bacterium]|nr:hypothetical protein [Candidatus Saccharibacteria bacterium]